MPVMVSAATMALTTASSVAWTVARKMRIERIVGQHGELMQALGADGAGIGGGEGDEDVAGAVAGIAAVAAQAERNLAGDALELSGNQRSIGGDDDDDRADVVLPDRVLGNFAADVNAGDAELLARSVVALHEDADGVAAGFRHRARANWCRCRL